MVRYLISLVILLCGIIFGVITVGASALSLVDLPSFVLVAIVPFLSASVLYSFKEMANAFSTPFKKENTQDNLTKAATFFQKYGKITWAMGITSAIIGIMGTMRNLEDPAALGPKLALALMSLFYSGLINVLIVIPFLLLIKKQMTAK